MNQNPFEFGIFQRVRRWFGREPVKITIDIEPDKIDVEKILEQLPECKKPAFRNGLTRIGTKVPPPPPEYRPKPAMPPQPPKQNKIWIELDNEKINDHLSRLQGMLCAAQEAEKNQRAALIAVIEQWGPITFADETIEANKKKKISIKRENGFVKFSIGESNDQRTNETAAGVQCFPRDAGESGDGSAEGQLQADASEAPRCDPGRVWYDHVYSKPDMPRD